MYNVMYDYQISDLNLLKLRALSFQNLILFVPNAIFTLGALDVHSLLWSSLGALGVDTGRRCSHSQRIQIFVTPEKLKQKIVDQYQLRSETKDFRWKCRRRRVARGRRPRNRESDRKWSERLLSLGVLCNSRATRPWYTSKNYTSRDVGSLHLSFVDNYFYWCLHLDMCTAGVWQVSKVYTSCLIACRREIFTSRPLIHPFQTPKESSVLLLLSDSSEISHLCTMW